MSFVGIVSNNKEFKNIRKCIFKNSEFKKLNLIEINEDTIENIKNIVFEIIIVCEDFKFIDKNNKYFEKICNNSKYLILNYDFDLKLSNTLTSKNNIITFGLNQKSTVTISSITDEQIVLSLQRNIIDVKKHIKEVEEKSLTLKKHTNNNNDIYIVLIIYILNLIYL